MRRFIISNSHLFLSLKEIKTQKIVYSSLFLFLGLFFSLMTKLRLPNFPIGLSDVFFLLFAITAYVKDGLRSYSQQSTHFLIISISCLIISDIGACFHFFEDFSLHLFFRNNIAFIYVTFLCWLFLKYNSSFETVFKVFILTTIFLLTFFSFFEGIGALSFFYSAHRFSFLSTNPNQIAIFITPIPFFIFHILYSSSKTYEKINNFLWITAFFCSLYISFRILTFTVFFSWMVALALFIFWSFNKIKKTNKYTYVSIFIFIAFIAFFFYISLCFLDTSYALSYDVLGLLKRDIYFRFDIFKKLINKIIDCGFLLGYGPGALIALSDNPAYDLNYHYGSSLNSNFLSIPQIESVYSEPHDAFLGVAFYGGIFPLLAVIYGGYTILKSTLYAKEKFLFLAFFSLVLFSIFHAPIRMPIFWFYLVYIYKTSHNENRVA